MYTKRVIVGEDNSSGYLELVFMELYILFV